MRHGDIESKTIEGKQEKLIAGDGITIDESTNTISSTVTGNTVVFDTLTEEQQASLKGDKGDKGDKGSEGEPFKISKVFTSAEDFYNYNPDTNEVLNGEFVIINNEVDLNDIENGKVYQRGNFSWTYIVDMSNGGTAFDASILNDYQEKMVVGNGLSYDEITKTLEVELATTTGQSETITMTQKAITDAIANGGGSGGTTLPINSNYSLVKDGTLVDIGNRLIDAEALPSTELIKVGNYEPPYMFGVPEPNYTEAPLYAYVKDSIAGKSLSSLSVLVAINNTPTNLRFGYTRANSLEDLRNKIMTNGLQGPEVEIGTLNFSGHGTVGWETFEFTYVNPSVTFSDPSMISINGIEIPEDAYLVFGDSLDQWNTLGLGLQTVYPEFAPDGTLKLGNFYKTIAGTLSSMEEPTLLAINYTVSSPAYTGYEVPVIDELDNRLALLENASASKSVVVVPNAVFNLYETATSEEIIEAFGSQEILDSVVNASLNSSTIFIREYTNSANANYKIPLIVKITPAPDAGNPYLPFIQIRYFTLENHDSFCEMITLRIVREFGNWTFRKESEVLAVGDTSSKMAYAGSTSITIVDGTTSYIAPVNGWFCASAIANAETTTISNITVYVGSLIHTFTVVPKNLSPNNSQMVTFVSVPVDAGQSFSWSVAGAEGITLYNMKFVVNKDEYYVP